MMRKVFSLVLCLLLPSALLGGNTGVAMGNFNGDVSVNGRAAPPNTAVFPGDKVITGRNAAAYISRPGFTLSLGSDSSAELLGGGARMLNGSVYVTLKPGAIVEYADLHITAASEIATVEIVSRKGSERIAARSGNLNVSDTTSSMTVPQGQACMQRRCLVPHAIKVSEISASQVRRSRTTSRWVVFMGIGWELSPAALSLAVRLVH